MTYIIGLAGPDRVGKTTTARALCSLLGNQARVMAFADEIYSMASAILRVGVSEIKRMKDVVLDATNAPLPELVGRTYRDFLKMLGTEFGRNMLGPDVWVNLAMRSIPLHKPPYAIFDDVRFPNEASRCHLVIELSRDGVDYTRNHASSHPLPRELVHMVYHLDQSPQEVAHDLLNFAILPRIAP